MLKLADLFLGALDQREQERAERERLDELNQPVTLPADPLIAVRIIESFVIGAPFAVPSRDAVVGEVVSLPRSLAADLIALRRVERFAHRAHDVAVSPAAETSP